MSISGLPDGPAPATPATPGRKLGVGTSVSPDAEVRVEVQPPWPFRLAQRNSRDGLTQCRNGVLHRLLHIDGVPVLTRVTQLSSGNVLFGASHPEAIARMRRALWVDLDLTRFYREFRNDPWIGAAVRRDPTLRPPGRPSGFEALTAAVTEQLIEYDRAVSIQRRIHAHLGATRPASAVSPPLRDSATAHAIAGVAPARLESFDLAARRAIALIRVARQVAMGRINLDDPDPAVQEDGWRRLKRIPDIGSWTIEMLALTGQGRIDQVPAGDLGFIKMAGANASGGDPRARGTEQDVRELFARFGEWQGLAGAYALRSAGMSKTGITR